MSASMSKISAGLPSLKIDEEAILDTEKQGIVSILGSDLQRPKAASLRRTLSADMSSRKWMAQHGFSSMKKIASSEQFPITIEDSSSSSSSEGEEDYYEERKELERPGQFEVWSSIQAEKKKKELEQPGQFDIWNSILSQKAGEDLSKLPAYVHPLVKRSSSLSEKSLQICTESLGSETGSDGFSSHPPSETGDVDEEKEQQQQQLEELEEQEKVSLAFNKEELRVANYNCSYVKRSPARSFPPPLPSLSYSSDGASLHMQSHRKNGRLVLEAVSVPSQDYFHAQRQDGRLVLTLANSPASDVEEEEKEKEKEKELVFDEEFERLKYEEMGEKNEDREELGHEVFEELDQEEGKEGEEEDEQVVAEDEEENIVETENGNRVMGIVVKQAPKLASELMNVHRPELMVNKLIRLANSNPTWPNKFKKVVEFEEEEVLTPLPKSFPPPARVARLIPSPPAAAAATASFNAYEYCWRSKPATATTILSQLTQQSPPLKNTNNKFILCINSKAHEQQELLKRCKEPRRSLLIWEPYCIATS